MDEAMGETALPDPYRVLSGFKLEGWMLEQKLSMGGNLDTEGSRLLITDYSCFLPGEWRSPSSLPHIQGTLYPAPSSIEYMGVNHRGLHILVAQ